MLSLLFLAYLPLTSGVCDGYFRTDDNVCKFKCYDGTFEEISSLTFAEIRDKCDDVMDGYRWNRAECSNLSDLVWGDGCSCPYCGCASPDTVGTSQSWTQLIQKSCKNCKCTTHPYYSSAGNVYQCETIARVSDPYNWDDFRCPATKCTDTVSQETHHAGESYFAHVDGNKKCDKFCYCNFDGTSECQTGFDNIINRGSATLKAAFWDRCEWKIKTCTDAPGRMYTEYQGPSCGSYGCPKCNCGSNAVDDIWWTSFVSHVDSTTCTRCQCKQDDILGDKYAVCDESESYPNSGIGSYQCPGAAVISCHSQDEYDDCSGTTCVPTVKAKSDSINSRESKTNQPDAWCTNSQEIYSYDDEDIGWHWGSNTGTDLFCGIYGTNEQCGWYEYSISWTDCYGDSRTESSTTYEYCCNTDNCNYIDINMDKTTCTEHTELSQLLQTLNECMYTGNGTRQSGWFGEDCGRLEEEVLSCTFIKHLYEKEANCLCRAYKGLYDAANAEWKVWIEDKTDMFMTSFTEWNDVLNCSGMLTCDLTAGSPEVRFVGKALFTFMIGLIMLN